MIVWRRERRDLKFMALSIGRIGSESTQAPSLSIGDRRLRRLTSSPKDVQPQIGTIAALAARPVEQVMRAPVLTIEARAPLHEIAEMLKVHDIKRLPVMRGNRMVGIVSRSDLVRAMATQIPKRAMRNP